jgi:polyisoprenoid-binding protein YceI
MSRGRLPGEPEDMTTQTLPVTGTYTLDPEQTVIRCDTKAMMGLVPVHGTFRLTSGEVTIADDPARSAVRARIAVASWESGNPMRDAHVKSAALLDVKSHPEITFTGTAARPVADGSGWDVAGSVTAHGKTHPVTVRVTRAAVDAGGVWFTVVASVNRTDFGVSRMRQRIGRTMNLTIEAFGVRA